MTVPTFYLTGRAIGGIAPHLDHLAAAVAANNPVPVKLGRIAGPKRSFNKRLEAYFTAAGVTPPDSVDWSKKASASLSRMFLNDQYGDCVIAGKAHALGVATGTDSDSGGIVLPSDEEVYQQYQSICGPGDNGCIITDVLDVMQSRGFLAGGKYCLIDGYVPMDWSNKTLVQVVIALLGVPSIGFSIPQAWMNSDVWDVTNSPIVGGHDVTPLGYNAQGVQVASWGRIYTITWAAFLSTRYLDEMYAVLWEGWYNADKLAPSGIDAAALLADLQLIAAGDVPPLTPPGLSLSVSPTTVQVNQDVSFTSNLAVGATGTLNFGDGSPGVTMAPGSNALHKYLTPGSFSATLKTDKESASASVSVTSEPPPPPPPPQTITLTGQTETQDYTFNLPGILRPHTVTIPGQTLDITVSGPMPGVDDAAGVSFLVIMQDVFAIFAAVKSGNTAAIIAAVNKLLADLGLNKLGNSATYWLSESDRQDMSFLMILEDAFALFAAIKSKNPAAIAAALAKLLADLGIG